MFIDDFLLDKIFEPLAHKIQWNWRISPFTIAAQLFYVSLILYFVNCGLDIIKVGSAYFTNIINDIVMLLVLWCIYSFIKRCDKLKTEYENMTTPVLNSERLNGQFSRIYLLFFITFGIYRLITELDISIVNTVIFTSAFYFMAVTPRPPSYCKKKVSSSVFGGVTQTF